MDKRAEDLLRRSYELVYQLESVQRYNIASVYREVLDRYRCALIRANEQHNQDLNNLEELMLRVEKDLEESGQTIE